MKFNVWNDTDTTLGRIMAANNRRKAKAKQDQAYRDTRAEVLQILVEGIKRTNDLKVHMNACQRMTDELMELLYKEPTDE